MKENNMIVAKNGIKMGDFVLVTKSGIYGKVIHINKRFATRDMLHRKIKTGDELDSTIRVKKVLNSNFTPTHKNITISLYEAEDCVIVGRTFIKHLFKKLNDTLAFIKMTNEKERGV